MCDQPKKSQSSKEGRGETPTQGSWVPRKGHRKDTQETHTGNIVKHRKPTAESEHFRKSCFLGRRCLGRRFLSSCFFRSASGRKIRVG